MLRPSSQAQARPAAKKQRPARAETMAVGGIAAGGFDQGLQVIDQGQCGMDGRHL